MGRPKGSKNKKKIDGLVQTIDLPYQVTFNANNTSYNAEGPTLLEALGNIPLTALELKTKGDLIVRHGERVAQKHLLLVQGRALVRSHIRRKGFAYQLEALLR